MALERAKLSDFKLAGALGSGATSKVYDAVHLATGRPVAIKVMAEADQSHELGERFAREALLLSGVQSRHVSKILGFGFDKGRPFLVLERLHGETLDAKLRRDGPVPIKVAVRWIEQLIVGVRDSHDAKVIHRDIKPSNIFLHQEPSAGVREPSGAGLEETVKLIDFGVARLRELTGESGGLTSTSHVIGSMGYMAPEQFQNAKSVGFPADLYALGVVIFRTLTGRLPFVSRSLEAIIRMKREQRAPPISSMPGMVKNPLLDWFVDKALVRYPAARFQSAREMLEQWWGVMASVDEDGVTEYDLRVVGVDESAARQRSQRSKQPVPLPSARGPTQLSAGISGVTALPAMEAAEDEAHTIRRPPGFAMPVSRMPTVERTIPDEPPVTIRSSDVVTTEVHVAVDDGGGKDDEFDVPTKSDPNLRKLVERELELQKARRRGSE
jgi:serine/threonine-protein kinase